MLRRIANSLPLSCFRPPSADDDQVAPHRQDQSPALPGVHRADATEPSAGEENRLLSHSAGNERVEERKTTPKELEQTAESSMRSRLVATLRQQRWIRPRAMNAATSDNDRDVVEPDAGEPHASSSQSTWPGKALQGRPVPQEASLFEKHLTGVVIWPHQVDNDELSSIVDKNYEYGAHLHEGVLKGGDNIRNGTIKSFADLWNYATDVRTSVPNFDASKMALFRSPQKVDSDLATPLNGQYDYIRGCVKNHPMFVRKSPVWESTLAMHGDIPDANGQTQRVDLTKFSPVGSPTMGRDWERGYITHTLPNQHPPIRKHLERLYREAMDAPDDATFKDKAARLYWWSAHACFDQRGSAAKTEIAFRSMYQARGLHCPLWQPGVSADVEAMLCLEDEWVEKHEQLMLSEDALVRESEKIDPMEWADMALKREVGE